MVEMSGLVFIILVKLISHVGDSTNPGLSIFVAGTESGPALRINKANDETGEALNIWNQAYDNSLYIAHDRTDSTAAAILISNNSLGLDASSNNWTIDSSGNIFTHGDIFSDATSTIRSQRFAFDSIFSMTASSMFLDQTNLDMTNSGIAGQVYQQFHHFLLVPQEQRVQRVPQELEYRVKQESREYKVIQV